MSSYPNDPWILIGHSDNFNRYSSARRKIPPTTISNRFQVLDWGRGSKSQSHHKKAQWEFSSIFKGGVLPKQLNWKKWQKRAKSGAQKIEKNTGKNDTGGVKEVENGELVVRAKRAFYI